MGNKIFHTTFDYNQPYFMARNTPSQTDERKPCTSVTVKGIPQDIMSYILTKQWELKIQKGAGQFSQSSAIISIIREHKNYKENKK